MQTSAEILTSDCAAWKKKLVVKIQQKNISLSVTLASSLFCCPLSRNEVRAGNTICVSSELYNMKNKWQVGCNVKIQDGHHHMCS